MSADPIFEQLAYRARQAYKVERDGTPWLFKALADGYWQLTADIPSWQENYIFHHEKGYVNRRLKLLPDSTGLTPLGGRDKAWKHGRLEHTLKTLRETWEPKVEADPSLAMLLTAVDLMDEHLQGLTGYHHLDGDLENWAYQLAFSESGRAAPHLEFFAPRKAGKVLVRAQPHRLASIPFHCGGLHEFQAFKNCRTCGEFLLKGRPLATIESELLEYLALETGLDALEVQLMASGLLGVLCPDDMNP